MSFGATVCALADAQSNANGSTVKSQYCLVIFTPYCGLFLLYKPRPTLSF
jgi:hypothetical protein